MNDFQKKEAEDRVKKFSKEYEELCKKFECVIYGVPILQPVNDRHWGIQVVVQPVDTKYADKPSPYLDKGFKL